MFIQTGHELERCLNVNKDHTQSFYKSQNPTYKKNFILLS